MEAVYNKTLSKLFNGARNASNNNLKVQENTFIKTYELEKSELNPSSAQSNSMDSKTPDIFNINFSAARNIDKTSTICVSCVRFSSTARALNPAIIASSRPCSSCNGSTCQLCLNQCKGCSIAVCGNCSIDIESVNGYKAEMFIVCLGCRDRYDSTDCMDTG